MQSAVKAWTRVMANAEAVYITLNKKTKHLRLCHGIGVDWLQRAPGDGNS